jgi:hypothetical protein
MNGEQNNYGVGIDEGGAAPQAAPQNAPLRPAAREGNRKSPAFAAVLSLMPGLGQIYTGYYQQGFIIMAVTAVTITILNAGVASVEPLFGFFLAFFWLYNVIDANRRAHHCNRIAAGLAGENAPEEFDLPGAKGSAPAGIVLVIVGALLLLEMNTDIPMDWLETWWPVLLVAGGVWMVVKSRRRAG